jgi:hypothetical protein
MTDKQDDTCIICLGVGDEPLIENNRCPCKYKRHNSCWIDYVHSIPNIICLECKVNLSSNAPSNRPQPVITTPLLNTQTSHISISIPNTQSQNTENRIRLIPISGYTFTMRGIVSFTCITLSLMIIIILIFIYVL